MYFVLCSARVLSSLGTCCLGPVFSQVVRCTHCSGADGGHWTLQWHWRQLSIKTFQHNSGDTANGQSVLIEGLIAGDILIMLQSSFSLAAMISFHPVNALPGYRDFILDY